MTNTDNALSTIDAEDAFLNLWADEDAELSSLENENTHDEDDVDDEEDAELSESDDNDDEVNNEADEDQEADDDEPEDKPKRKVLSDDDVVSVKIDGEETEVSLSDLKRHYGQHRANDLRSKELHREKKTLEDHSHATRIAAETLYNRAAEKAKQWEGIDWVEALKTLDTPSYNELRKLAEKDYSDLNFFHEGLQHEVQRHEARKTEEVTARISATVAELSNPETGIEGFNEPLLRELGNYALSMGVPEDRMQDLFHTPIMRILHDAARYRKAQAATKATTPVKKTATKIVKSTSNSETSRKAAAPKNNSALDKLKRSGSQDDAEQAFLAMWKDD